MSSLNDSSPIYSGREGQDQVTDDNAHFSELFEKLSPRLRLFALKLGATPDEADEVVSQTFESYLVRQQKGRPRPDNPEAYLVTIARNHFYQMKRGERPTQSIEQDEVQIPSPFVDTTLSELENTLVGRALKALSPSDREIIWLRLVEEQSTEEVTEKLNIKENAARTRFHRAQSTFRTNYLVAFTESAQNTVCQTTAKDLVRYVDGSLPSRRTERLLAHLETCERCPRVVAEVKDEAATIYRIPLVIAGIFALGGLVEFSNATNKAAAASLLATLLALAGWLLLIVGIGGLLITPTVTLSDSQVNGTVVPASTSLGAPAPGHSIDWSMTTTLEEAAAEVPIYIAISGAEQRVGEDQPLLTLSVAGKPVLDQVVASDYVGQAVRVGKIGPGESLTVSGRLDRAASDQDEKLDLSIAFAFTTQPSKIATVQSDVSATPATSQTVEGDGTNSLLDRILQQALRYPLLLAGLGLGASLLITSAILARKNRRTQSR